VNAEDADRKKDLAVILNENAKKVTRRVLRSAQDLAPRISLYTTRTKEEARQIVREIMDRGTRRIICGGGDGTFSSVLGMAKECLEEQHARLQSLGQQARSELARLSMPQFGILKLGTGNSMAPVLGIKNGLKPVRRLIAGEDFGTRRINLMEAEKRCFTFCGLGWDAQILNDYNWLKQRVRAGILGRLAQTLLGYLAAIGLRTIPKVLLSRRKITARVRNMGRRLYRVERNGTLKALDCPAGEVFYEGPCHIVGTGTTPFYGYRLKAFPSAMRHPGLMQVRIVTAGVAELVTHALPIWAGTYRSPNFQDYLAENVHFSFSEAVPLQIGGDAEGYRSELSVQVSALTVDLLDFRRPLLQP